MSTNPVVLCVDDEQRIVAGLRIHFRKHGQILTASSGEEALERLAEHPGLAVIMSDMRMPGMTGAQLLAEVRRRSPNTVRILLTGQADVPSAVAAINEGQVFRFLTKPSSPEELKLALEAALRQHELLVSEQVLREKTVTGCVRALSDVLALTSPLAFGRAARIRRCALLLARTSGHEHIAWALEVVSTFSQLGSIVLTEELAEKIDRGDALTPAETATAARLPGLAEQLVGHIPRLDDILEILGELHHPAPVEQQRVETRILRIVIDYEVLERKGHSPESAIQSMRERDRYDRTLLSALATALGPSTGKRPVRLVPLHSLTAGMVLAEDVRTSDGRLLMTGGVELQPSFLQRLISFRDRIGGERLPVYA